MKPVIFPRGVASRRLGGSLFGGVGGGDVPFQDSIEIAQGSSDSITLTGLEEDDLVLVVLGSESGTPAVTSSGYMSHSSQTSASTIIILGKSMGATPDTTVEVDAPAGVPCSVIVTAIRGAANTVAIGPVSNLVSNTTVTPPALNVQPDEWFLVAANLDNDGDSTVSSFPAGYTNTLGQNCGDDTEGSVLAVAFKKIESDGSEQPGDFVFSSSDFLRSTSIAFEALA